MNAADMPLDQPERDRIATELGTTLFVEAGAGSGKTTALVGRVVNLVDAGVELRTIAAITFTEKAGAELRDRIRRALEQRAREAAGDDERTRYRAAMDQLDGAAIGTLHSFAQRILSENPVEAGLPPRIEVLDEVTSDVEFERRWSAFRDQLFADPNLERTLLLLFETGVQHKALRTLALEFDHNWDLVADRVGEAEPEPPPVHDLLDRALASVDAACAQAHRCIDPEDKLLALLQAFAGHAERLRAIDDEFDLLAAVNGRGIESAPVARSRIGRKPSWRGDIDEVRALVATAATALAELNQTVAVACARRLGSSLRWFTLGAAAERRARGELEFHDLLVLARSLVRDPVHGATVRARLHERYQHLMLDEFQDTDPIQIELAVRIAAADPSAPEAGTAPWPEVPVASGHLFVVGDPKQSIYRFRRADIATFLAARARFGPDGGGVVELTANFRTGEPVIGWVNVVFGKLLAQPPSVALPVPSQPEYTALLPVRPSPPVGPPVSVIGRDAVDGGSAADLRAAEAEAVAHAVRRAVAEGWSVGTGSEAEPWRPATLGDVTILVPARTSLPFLQDALAAAGIAYRTETSSLVYASRAVRDLLMVARAIDDPTDHLQIVAALRSPLFGCGDDDLFRFKVERHGRFDYTATQPGTLPANDPVAAALAYLRNLHDERRWRSPSELLDGIAADRRAFELGFAEGRPRDVWRRLRFVIDQARSWSEATAGSLRQYLQWVKRQTGEGARVAEAILPETDDDAVRIMTIHAAKGLEFPITILSGMSTKPGGRASSADVVFPPTGGVGYRIGTNVETPEFTEWKPIDEQMGYHERIRLLYVACTRAQDHLVVSLQRKARTPSKPEARTNAELLVDGCHELLPALPDAVGDDMAPPELPAPVPVPAPAPFEQWQAERHESLRAGSRPSTVAATALTAGAGSGPATPSDASARVASPPAATGASAAGDLIDPSLAGLHKLPRDLDLPPWLKGRYGTAVGRAVHGILQTVDLDTGDGLDDAVAAQCEAEAITDRAAEVGALARAALAAGVVRRAAAGSHWREVYTCTPLADGRLLEGYIDLLFRNERGLVVVDYKTAASSDPAELARRVDIYRRQGAAYALAVARTTGEPVTDVVFLFLTPDGPIEVALDGLETAVAEVEQIVQAGHEIVAV